MKVEGKSYIWLVLIFPSPEKYDQEILPYRLSHDAIEPAKDLSKFSETQRNPKNYG